MAGLNPLPTHVHHRTTRLTHREAHTFLSSFLDRAEIDAAYRPDSTLSERGPISRSAGGNPNLTLHHLKRILKGIEGKRVGGEDVNRFFTADGVISGGDEQRQTPRRKRGFENEQGLSSPLPSREKRRRKSFEDPNPDDEGVGIAVEGESEGWQDKDDYELAQRDDGVDVAAEDRHPGADLEQPDDEAEEAEMVEVEIERTGEKVDLRTDEGEVQKSKKSKADKEERKRLKKLKGKDEKKKREEQRKRAK